VSNGLMPTRAQLQQHFEILQNTIRSGEADVLRCWAAMDRIQGRIAVMDAQVPTTDTRQEKRA